MLLSLFTERISAAFTFGDGAWQKMRAAVGFCLISHRTPLNVRMRIAGQKYQLVFSSGSDIAMFIEVFKLDEYALPSDVSPRTILDLGANVGFASLSFACRFPSAKILALEPDPQNIAVLKKNCAQAGIQVLPGAIAGEVGTRTFFSAIGQGMSSSFQERGSAQKIEVQAFSLASLLARIGWQSVDLVKFDVEGAEWEVFKAADLRSVKALIGEYHEDLTGKTLAEFLSLFPGFEAKTKPLTKRRYSVFLRKIDQ